MLKACGSIEQWMQRRLEGELERLKSRVGLGLDLRVVWLPRTSGGLSGEVKGKTIYVYDEDGDEGVKTLRHEYLDYVITSRIVEPLVSLVNLLIKSREAEVYKSKEEVVEKLSRLLS